MISEDRWEVASKKDKKKYNFKKIEILELDRLYEYDSQ